MKLQHRLNHCLVDFLKQCSEVKAVTSHELYDKHGTRAKWWQRKNGRQRESAERMELTWHEIVIRCSGRCV